MLQRQRDLPVGILLALMCLLGAVALTPPSSLGLLYYIVVRDNLSKALAAAMGMTLAWEWAAGRRAPRLCAGHTLFLLFVLSAAVSIVYCADRTAGAQRAHLFFSGFVVTLAGRRVFADRERILVFARWVAVVAAALCVIGILEDRRIIAIVTPDVKVGNQIASALGYPTVYGGFLLAAIAAVQCGWSLAERKADKALFGFALAMLFVNLYLSRTIAAWLMFGAMETVVLAGPLLNALRDARARRVLFAAAVIAAAVGISFMTLTVRGGKDIKYILRKAESAEKRHLGWSLALEMAGERPALGFGAGQFDVYLPLYRARAGQANYDWETDESMYYPINTDNFVLNKLVEQGAVGLALFLGIFAWTFAAAFRARGLTPPERRALVCQAAGVAAIVGYALFHFPFLAPGVWGLVWVNVSIVWALARKGAAEAAEEPPPANRAPAGRLAAAALFALCAYLFYLPLGMWINDVKMTRGVMLAATKGMEPAREQFESALPLVPKAWRYYYFHGRALAMNNRSGEAVEQLKIAAKMRPYNLLVLRQLMGGMSHDPAAAPAEIRALGEKLEKLDVEAPGGGAAQP